MIVLAIRRRGVADSCVTFDLTLLSDDLAVRLLLEKNFVGLCTDRETNMISSRGAGLANRLIKDYPYAIFVHDYSHIINIVAKNAVLELPKKIIKMVKTITSHLSKPQNSVLLHLTPSQQRPPKGKRRQKQESLNLPTALKSTLT